MGYAKVKQAGYEEAEAKYTQIIKDYENSVNKKIDNIESLSNLLIIQGREDAVLLSQDMQTIVTSIKRKPLVIVKDGECNPNATFSDTLSKINQRANQTVKDRKP
jgi:esterase/lipase